MNKLKKYILVLIFIVAIIMITVISLNSINKEDNENIIIDNVDYNKPNSEVRKVKAINNFYSVKSCVESFYSYYKDVFLNEQDIEHYKVDIDLEQSKKETSNILFSMLDEEYIKEFNVTEENITKELPPYTDSIIMIDDMYENKQTQSTYTYFVYGRLINKHTSEVSNFSVIVKMDFNNKTFSILPENYMLSKNYINIQEGKNIKIENFDKIEDKVYNVFFDDNVSDEQYIKDLLNNYKNNALYDLEYCYNLLEDEYKNERFGSLESYKKYIDLKSRDIVLMEASKYKVYDNNGLKQYIVIDNKENYYIFIEENVMCYSIILDTYTVDLPEFLKKYNSGNEQTKVGMNIEKFIDSINEQDYKYAYSKLAESFKNNYYKNQEEFETYIKQNMFEKNEVKYENYKKEGNTHIYTLKISDKEGQNAKTMTIIMKLLEGTDFVMSFNIQ